MKGSLTQITTLSTTLNHPNQALLFELDELYAVLRQIKDRRGKQGRQYPLAEILLIGILAKLAGQTSSRAMAEWAKLRSQDVAAVIPSPARQDASLQHLEPDHGTGHRSRRVGAG